MGRAVMEPETIENEIVSIERKRLDDYEKLLALAEQQQAILLEGRHDELNENIAQFDPLLVELKQLDRWEDSLFKRLDQRSGDSSDPSINVNDKCRDIVRMTLSKAAHLRTLTETNKNLLANAMQFVDMSMGIICRVAAEASSVGNQSGNPAIVLDTRA
jgi:hypothetical protein